MHNETWQRKKNKEEGQKVVFEALDSKSWFSSILETFTHFPNNVYFISVHCTDHSTYTVHNLSDHRINTTVEANKIE